MKLVLTLMVSVVLGAVFLNILSDSFTNATSEAATQTISYTTGAAETTATGVLTRKHWYADATGLSAACATDTGTTPATVDATRFIVTVSGLTASTTQDCVITHRSDKINSDGNVKSFVGIVKIAPLLVALTLLGASFALIGFGAAAARGKDIGPFGQQAGGGIGISAFLVILVGFFLLDTIEDFIDTAQTTYDNLPEFSGVASLLGIVIIGYVLSIITLGIGGVASGVRGQIRK